MCSRMQFYSGDAWHHRGAVLAVALVNGHSRFMISVYIYLFCEIYLLDALELEAVAVAGFTECMRFVGSVLAESGRVHNRYRLVGNEECLACCRLSMCVCVFGSRAPTTTMGRRRRRYTIKNTFKHNMLPSVHASPDRWDRAACVRAPRRKKCSKRNGICSCSSTVAYCLLFLFSQSARSRAPVYPIRCVSREHVRGAKGKKRTRKTQN